MTELTHSNWCDVIPLNESHERWPERQVRKNTQWGRFTNAKSNILFLYLEHLNYVRIKVDRGLLDIECSLVCAGGCPVTAVSVGIFLLCKHWGEQRNRKEASLPFCFSQKHHSTPLLTRTEVAEGKMQQCVDINMTHHEFIWEDK